jgi:hypothetical protein
VSFPLVILHFGSDVGDGSLCIVVPLVCCCQFPLLRLFDNCSHLRSHQGLVTVDLHDNFLNILKVFWLWRAIS